MLLDARLAKFADEYIMVPATPFSVIESDVSGAPGEIVRADKHGIHVAAREGGVLIRELQSLCLDVELIKAGEKKPVVSTAGGDGFATASRSRGVLLEAD